MHSAVRPNGAAQGHLITQYFPGELQVIDQIVPPSPSICTALDWDRVGEVLAVIQAGSSALILWTLSTRKVRLVPTPVVVEHGPTLVRDEIKEIPD